MEKKKKSFKEQWNSWSKLQKTGYVIFCVFIFAVVFNFMDSSSNNTSNYNSTNSKKETFPSGVSTACFCADYFNGGNMYDHTPSQNSKCRKMYICLDNAMSDCMSGNSSFWDRCEPLY